MPSMASRLNADSTPASKIASRLNLASSAVTSQAAGPALCRPGLAPQGGACQHGAHQGHPGRDKDLPPVRPHQGRRPRSRDRGEKQPEAPGHRDDERYALGPAWPGSPSRCRAHGFKVRPRARATYRREDRGSARSAPLPSVRMAPRPVGPCTQVLGTYRKDGPERSASPLVGLAEFCSPINRPDSK